MRMGKDYIRVAIMIMMTMAMTTMIKMRLRYTGQVPWAAAVEEAKGQENK